MVNILWKNNIMDMAMLLKQLALVIMRKGDPEQLSKDWEEYVNNFKIFLEATIAVGANDNPEVAGTPCIACRKSKNLIMLVGGSEVKTLFNHVRKVIATDSCNETLDKIERN